MLFCELIHVFKQEQEDVNSNNSYGIPKTDDAELKLQSAVGEIFVWF